MLNSLSDISKPRNNTCLTMTFMINQTFRFFSPVSKHRGLNYGKVSVRFTLLRICIIYNMCNVTSDNQKNYENKFDLQGNRIRNQNFFDLNAGLESNYVTLSGISSENCRKLRFE